MRSQEKADAWLARNPKLSSKNGGLVEFAVVEGGVHKAGALEEALKDVTVVAHVAADLPGAMAKGSAGVQRTIDGVLETLKSAKAASSVKRFVLTSSTAALGDPVRLLNEDDWNDATLEKVDSGKNSPYPAAKQLSEQAAWKFVEDEKPSFEFVTILPSAVIGPSVTQASPDLKAGSYGVVYGVLAQNVDVTKLQGLLSPRQRKYVDVRDVAEAHVQAATQQSASGKRFIASAQPEYSVFQVVR